MKLKITLLSDLCTYSGETFNSTVDTDVVYDDYGFPYIPAKRLKGCIREAFLELVQMGVYSRDDMKVIFGMEGNHASAFSLSNAYLEKYDDLVEDLKQEKDPGIVHPQNVLRLYSYTRTQTALDLHRGTAIKNTLRTKRVVKKGLVFEADVHFAKSLDEAKRQQFENAAEQVAHIGYQRSRGLGLVKIECVDDAAEIKAKVQKKELGEKNRLFYAIHLLSPMLCKSAEGNQAKTLQYIEGSKVLGLIAQELGNQAFLELMESQNYESGNEIIVSNAYIGHDGKRCTPIRASLQKKKDQKFDENGTMDVQDMMFLETTEDQMSSLGNLFADEDGYVQSVDTEINYHHKRPSDKSVGRATGEDDSAFYQMESIRKGQVFYGYIIADKAQSEIICDTVANMKNIRMGYGKGNQYGAVAFEIYDTKPIETGETAERIHDFQVKLNSSVIMYNENGMYAADLKTFEACLGKALAVTDLRIEKPFLKYETLGGFNVTWNRRKPVITALGMGTVCKVHSDTGISPVEHSHIFVGERVSEGFGEVELTCETNEIYTLRKEVTTVEEAAVCPAKTELLQELYKEAVKKNIAETARRDAKELVETEKFGKEADATLSRVLMIFKEQDDWEAMQVQIDGIENKVKHAAARKISKNIELALEKAYAYAEKLVNPLDKKEIYRIYGEAYLKQMKYLLRMTKEERRNGNGK